MRARQRLDWDAPLSADGPGRTDALHRALGLSTPALSSFTADLHASISSKDWGFPQLSDLADVDQRALVSDQLLSAVDGLVDALVDAAITARDVDAYTGPAGLPYPNAADSLNAMLRYERLRTSVAGFFDAVGTALGCLAAILIVVGRVPLSVQRADFTQLSRLDPAKPHSGAFSESVPEHQHDLWEQLVAELHGPPDAGSPDWLNWSLEMRNALTHRGRVTNVYLPRRISGRLAVPPTVTPESLYRYDLHLRSRPWLPAIEGILAGTDLPASWLDEPAGRTIAGLFSELMNYAERVMRWANACWTSPVQETLVPPVRRWVLPSPPQLRFAGINPGGTTPIASAIGGINQEHIRLAERLRRRRVGLPDADVPEQPR